ncbi:MAG: hypothetical protein IT479_00070 [Xanthomonadales bacterium]|nr:hypothetical protein [Xanthomonadales bacterium]MCC6591648.1 hypothetical protein [Xanthomonadales bacterium]MCE7932683.1 hypothetical protein [Xanthomonadales bacterium PRO6]
MSKRGVAVLGLALTCAQASAAVYTVGPGGSHATPQAAVDAAFANPGPDEVRLREGPLSASILIAGNLQGNDLSLSGGWDAAYASNAGQATTLDAGGSVAVLRASLSGGNLQLSKLRLLGGAAASQPAGLSLALSGFATALVGEVEVANGAVTGGSAGCIGLDARDDSQLYLYDSAVHDCSNGSAGPGGATAAGLKALAQGRAAIVIDSLQAHHNLAQASTQAGGAGVSLTASQQAGLVLRASRIHANTASAPGVFGAGLAVSLSGSASATLARLEIHDNLAPLAGSGTAQAGLTAADSSMLRMHSSLLRDGPQRGLTASTSSAEARVHLHNLSIVQHAERGFAVFGPTGGQTLHNSIVQDNGLPTALPAGAGDHNLGDDLGLANAVFVGAGDFRLAPGSPGIDAGTASVPLGLAFTDLIGEAREQGLAVDIGAYERPAPLFLSGFE